VCLGGRRELKEREWRLGRRGRLVMGSAGGSGRLGGAVLCLGLRCVGFGGTL
jgi:hypothetical protein